MLSPIVVLVVLDPFCARGSWGPGILNAHALHRSNRSARPDRTADPWVSRQPARSHHVSRKLGGHLHAAARKTAETTVLSLPPILMRRPYGRFGSKRTW